MAACPAPGPLPADAGHVVAEVALRNSCELGEGSIWVASLNAFVSVDIYGPSVAINGPAVFIHDPYDASKPVRAYAVPSYCGTVVPRAGGGLLVALQDGVYALDTTDEPVSAEEEKRATAAAEGTGQPPIIACKCTLTKLIDPETEAGNPRAHLNRYNDGKCSPEGRLWVGTMGAPGKVDTGAGGLYCVSPAGGKPNAPGAPRAAAHTSVRALGGITISNGLTWSTDGRTFYYTDTPTGEVWAFDYCPETGALSNKRTAVAIPPHTGHPDGCCLAVAPDGHETLWVAQWGGWRVVCYDLRSGAVERIISLPGAAHVSSCAFGGPGMGDLYVTTAKEHLDGEQRKAQPHAGCTFMVRGTGYRGLPAFEYRG